MVGGLGMAGGLLATELPLDDDNGDDDDDDDDDCDSDDVMNKSYDRDAYIENDNVAAMVTMMTTMMTMTMIGGLPVCPAAIGRRDPRRRTVAMPQHMCAGRLLEK